MVAKDLIPFNTMPKSQHLQMSRNGGKTTSVRKTEAAKWRELKKRMARDGVADEDIKYFLERMENRELGVADVVRNVELMGPNVHPAQRLAWANTMIQAMKLLHGEKIKTENVNVNINTTIEEWEKRLFDDNDE